MKRIEEWQCFMMDMESRKSIFHKQKK